MLHTELLYLIVWKVITRTKAWTCSLQIWFFFSSKKEASNNSHLLSPGISDSVIGEWLGWAVLAQGISQGFRPATYKTAPLWGPSWVGDRTFKWIGSWLQIHAGSWREARVSFHTDFSPWLLECPCHRVDQGLKPFCEGPKSIYYEHC